VVRTVKLLLCKFRQSKVQYLDHLLFLFTLGNEDILRFEISMDNGGVVSRGDSGVAYEATDLRLQRRVAAKVMMGSSFGDITALRRFEREARAAAKIDHRHITRVHDYGAIGSGGVYLIMELVARRTWREELKRSSVIPPARAADRARTLAS
jgi:serine/threonine protein kinase